MTILSWQTVKTFKEMCGRKVHLAKNMKENELEIDTDNTEVPEAAPSSPKPIRRPIYSMFGIHM